MRVQRDLFLLLTLFGTFLSLMLVFASGLYFMEQRTAIAYEIAGRIAPASVIGGTIFLGTFFAYRRYQKLLAGENR